MQPRVIRGMQAAVLAAVPKTRVELHDGAAPPCADDTAVRALSRVGTAGQALSAASATDVRLAVGGSIPVKIAEFVRLRRTGPRP